MLINDIILKLKNSYAGQPNISAEDLSELSKEEVVKVADWLISAIKLECDSAKATQIFERTGYDLDVEFYEDDAIELYTFPDNDNYFTKKFEVEKGWLIDCIIDLDKDNERLGANLKNFLGNYDMIESEAIYERAKAKNKLLSEVDLVITKDIIRQGMNFGYIHLVLNPHGSKETVCKIGEYWFYFGGTTAEGMTPEQYLDEIPFETIVDEIYEVLEGFRESEECRDEYAYYETYLREQHIQELFVIDLLRKFSVKYERITDSPTFNVYGSVYYPTKTFSIVNITENGLIEVDKKTMSNDEFFDWVNYITD